MMYNVEEDLIVVLVKFNDNCCQDLQHSYVSYQGGF